MEGMSKGYGGLPKRRAESRVNDLGEDFNKGNARKYPEADRSHRIHIVDVDRRAIGRFDMSRYPLVTAPSIRGYDVAKRCFDVLGASLALLLLSPLIVAIVAISYASGQPPIFRHRRVGQHGVCFNCLKFRTMVPNASQVLQDLLNSDRQIKEEWLRDHKLKDDPRVTRLGRFLRRTSLDELPQLWNVILGEMSLVGPRPVVPDELPRYGNRVGIFLSAVPGVTGLWQVSGRNNTDYRRRVALDVCYIRSRSIVLDIFILLKTLPAVFAKNGAY
jgi:lipopolysaccharide/colanic/teichoic acid biosynthesis glycosyltransferase